MTQTRTSDEFLTGLAFHLEMGGEINETSVPKLLAAIDKVESPDGRVGEIKGVLETLQAAEYTSRLTSFTADKVNEVLQRTGKAVEPEPRFKAMC